MTGAIWLKSEMDKEELGVKVVNAHVTKDSNRGHERVIWSSISFFAESHSSRIIHHDSICKSFLFIYMHIASYLANSSHLMEPKHHCEPHGFLFCALKWSSARRTLGVSAR